MREDEIAREYDMVRTCIKELRWNETIEFRGTHYGVPPILDGIHRENDCGGHIFVTTVFDHSPNSFRIDSCATLHVCVKCHTRVV
jgi:hypothetical protein